MPAGRCNEKPNNGYGMWWNHGQVGHVFQGRFRAILLEEGGTLLAVSQYLHFNPVAVKNLGWGKREKTAENRGATAPSGSGQETAGNIEIVSLEQLRDYAGYAESPAWLKRDDILRLVKGGSEGYRKRTEGRLGQGQPEDIWSTLKWSAILGSERFVKAMRARTAISAKRRAVGSSARR